MNNSSLIFDFDSTIVNAEALEELAKEALSTNPRKEEILNELMNITKEGMEGKIPFAESLKRRLALINFTQAHLDNVIEIIKTRITPSFERNIEELKKISQNIYIVSGGFEEVIWPISD